MTDDPSTNSERRWVCVNEVHYGLPCNESTPHSVCARYYAAPVPSPVPSRPDTAQIRAMADEITTTGSGFPGLDTLDALTLILAADWIDAQPAADQGPDLSELAATIEALLLTDGPDGMAHWVYAPEPTEPCECQVDPPWTEEMSGDFRRMAARNLATKLAAALASHPGGEA